MMVCIGKNAFHGVVRSNKTAAEIIDLLNLETTREQIIQEMKKKYDVPENLIAVDVDLVIRNLRQIGALEE